MQIEYVTAAALHKNRSTMTGDDVVERLQVYNESLTADNKVVVLAVYASAEEVVKLAQYTIGHPYMITGTKAGAR